MATYGLKFSLVDFFFFLPIFLIFYVSFLFVFICVVVFALLVIVVGIFSMYLASESGGKGFLPALNDNVNITQEELPIVTPTLPGL